MATQTFGTGNYRQRGATPRPAPEDECLRYRFDVVASAAAEAVRVAGGWMYDRAAAGWEVTVLLPHAAETRPLRILGVRALDLESGFARPSTQGLTVLSGSPDHGWPLPLQRGMTKVQHVLSAAARVFKGHALAAAGISCGAVDPTETLLCDMAAGLPMDAELIRLG